MVEWIVANKALVLGLLLAISEGLGTFEYFKSSSIFMAVVGFVKKLAGKE